MLGVFEKHSVGLEQKQRVLDFIKEQPVGVLATVDPNGYPHASVIYYSVDDDFTIYFTTKAGTKKHDSLKHDSHAMLVAYEARSQSTLQVIGSTYEVVDEEMNRRIFEKTLRASMATSVDGIPPISKLAAGAYVAYMLKPRQIRMAVYARPDSGDGDRLFETLEFSL